MAQAAFLVAQLLVAAAGGLIGAGLLLAIGGLGEFRRLRSRCDGLEDAVRLANERLTRDQKIRAAAKGLESRQVTQSIEQEASDHLAAKKSPKVVRMPGRAQGRR